MARLYEYQGKQLLEKAGFRVPQGRVADTVPEAVQIAKELATPVVVKAQIWATGRAGVGGVRFATDVGEAKNHAEELIGRELKGLSVKRVLVEQQLSIQSEYYAGIIVSNSHQVKGPVLVFGTEGGSSVEEVAQRNPERIGSLVVDYLAGVSEQAALDLVNDISYPETEPSPEQKKELAQALCKLYRAFVEFDARSLEINPLVSTTEGVLYAADCHASLDDNSVFRHPELGIELPRDMDRPPTDLEKRAWQIEEGDYRGTGYFSQMVPKVEGPGWLGFHGVGGGGAMLGASAFVARGFKIANYADTSGDPPASKIYSVIRCILEQPVDGYVLMGACLANQEQWHHAHALVKALREFAPGHRGFPAVLLLGGNKEAEAHELLRHGLQDLPLRWELYGREYIYNTDFIADRVEALVNQYQAEKTGGSRS